MHSIAIRIPANMRALADGQATINVQASQVGGALDQLLERYPDLRARLVNSSGELQSFVNVFLNDRSIRDLAGRNTELTAGDQLLIVPALAGG